SSVSIITTSVSQKMYDGQDSTFPQKMGTSDSFYELRSGKRRLRPVGKERALPCRVHIDMYSQAENSNGNKENG
ncbi:hypothetical protein, partial [Escherichia coli]|uniref:hypothetical protein n=1 Tax=Escherichia coli TaxID=562 RepID=UPI001BDCAD96